jgi:hypothetical protein
MSNINSMSSKTWSSLSATAAAAAAGCTDLKDRTATVPTTMALHADVARLNAVLEGLLADFCPLSHRLGIPLGNSVVVRPKEPCPQRIDCRLTSFARCQVGDHTVMINNLIADGGYAFVYKERTVHSGCDWRRSISFFACLQATDVATGKEFALKKMICGDKESYDIACKEARFMQQLSPHPNIVQLHATSEIKGSSGTEVYFLMDLCTGGTLIDIMDRFEKKRSSSFPPLSVGCNHVFCFCLISSRGGVL